MKYYRYHRAQFIWDTETTNEEDCYQEVDRLELEYPNAKIDSIQDEDHYPYPWYIYIKFENAEDEAEFIMKELT